MTTYTDLSDTTLSQDKPLTQSIARAYRDNPLALTEGDATAPQKVEHKSIKTGAIAVTTTAGAGFTHSSGAVIPFTVETFDQEGWFNNTTYRYTPQKSGLYLVSCYCVQGTGGTATGASFGLRKNGTATGPVVTINAANVANEPLAMLVYLNGTTDYVDLIATYSGGSLTLGGSASNWMRAALVSYAP